jgi:hypothetical protein
MLPLGAKLHQVYVTALKTAAQVEKKKPQEKRETKEITRAARIATKEFLSHFPLPQRKQIVLAALATVYSEGSEGMDTAVWQMGEKEEGDFFQPSELYDYGMGGLTIDALRDIDLLDDLIPLTKA